MYIRGGCINHLCYFIKPDQVLYLGEALIEHSHEEIAPLRHTKCKTSVYESWGRSVFNAVNDWPQKTKGLKSMGFFKR